MIYTVTFNPAIDYVMKVKGLQEGKTNRSYEENLSFGGKGINVSFVLRELSVQSTALGFVAGFTGQELENSLRELGVSTDFVHLQKGITRINVKLKGDSETEINGKGPDISESELLEFYSKLDKIENGDTLVLAGSVPKSLPCDIYEKIMERFQGKGIRIILDAEKDLLLRCLKYHPFLIKPNKDELCNMVSKELSSMEDVKNGAMELKNMGALNVLISMGSEGSLLIDEENNVHTMGVAKIKAVNSVGAGDSMVAGFLAGLSHDYSYAQKLGTACGGATCALQGLATKEKIDEILQTL